MKQIFINLPVNELNTSLQFYLSLGFTENPMFTGEQQKSLFWSDTIQIMLQSRSFSNDYLTKHIIDPRKNQMPSFTLPVENKTMVDTMMQNGLEAGGHEPVPAILNNFMYLRSIEDPDGYIWGIMYLDIVSFANEKDKNKKI